MQTVVIVGAGPVGAVAAHLLMQRGFYVQLIHRANSKGGENSFKAGETLPPVANGLLRHLGLYELLEQAGHIKCPGNQSAFGSADLVDFDFIFTANGLGWHLDRRSFERQLLDRAEAAGARILTSKIQTAERQGDQWHLTLAPSAAEDTSETLLKADYLVDASGISRFLLRQKNIPLEHHDKLGARIAIFKTDAEQRDHRTLTEADHDGWWYSSCAPSGVRLVMFFSDSDLPGFQACGTREAFLERLEQTYYIKQKLASECADYRDLDAMSLYSEPARSTIASQLQGEKWIAIGDAAMSFDPLSSQGLWVGFQSANLAVQSIIDQAREGIPSCMEPNCGYVQWAKNVYDDYLLQRKNYYGMEQRWRNNEFWRRRNEDRSGYARPDQ